MKHSRSKFFFASMSILTASGLLISCTKSVPYESVYKGTGKEQVQEKSIIDTNTEYMYVASTDLMNQDSTGASSNRPYWQGEEKIVKFRFTENTLQVLKVNEEERLQDNRTNDKIVFEIPITHLDYKCAEDRYKKCTNKEEENKDTSWNQKSKFLPKFEDMKSIGISLLPTEMEKVFGGSCFEEQSSQFLGYEMTEDALNIQVQKVFKGDKTCLEKKGKRIANLESLADLQSQVIYHYSFTKLNKMTSANYKKIDYPSDDESTFGFFTTKTRKYDVDYNRTVKQEKQYMNRWNPERSEIVYYLTDNFNKPEFASMKKASYDAIEQVNKGLATAGVKTRIVLKNPDKKMPGDVRNSMIILVEDPVVGGPLGYGPTVANPRTGEILSGRVAMYYGNYVSNVQYVYDSAVREIFRERSEAANSKQNVGKSKENISANLAYQNKLASYVRANTSDKIAKSLDSNRSAKKAVSNLGDDRNILANQMDGKNLLQLSKTEFDKATLRRSQKSQLDDELATMSKYCNYPAELFPFNEIVRGTLRDKLGTQELKFWKDLTDAEKKVTMDILLPEVWKPTLVHEIGHNLGLRHNFGGSEDKANFYTKEELHKMNVTHEVPYSSVMDYGSSELNLLPTLGKYDIAALKFAYNRTVETAEGKEVEVKTTLKDLEKEPGAAKMKVFRYCTDDNVDVNPGCKRFDRGTNLNEIVEYLIQSNNDMYSVRNFRNGRENFSQMNDDLSFKSVTARFKYIRAFMERYESLKLRANVDDEHKVWTENPSFKEIKEAALKSGRFFIDVLKTPEPMCAVALVEKPEEVVQIMKLSEAAGDQLDCFAIKMNPKYMIVGQTGKAFNNMKDPESENHYADQIDVRGIYIDKIVAAKMLFNRRIDSSSYDKAEDNYYDIKDLRQELDQTITSVVIGNVQSDAAFYDKNGSLVMTTPVAHKIFSPPSMLKSSPAHWIATPLRAEVASSMGLPMHQISFQQVFLNIISDSLKESQSHNADSQGLLDKLSVTKTSKVFQLNKDSGAFVMDVGATRYVAMPENLVAKDFIATSTMMKLLESLDAAKLDLLIAEKTAEAAAPGVSATSAFAPEFKLIPLPVVTGFKQGILPKSEALDYLLTILPQANAGSSNKAATAGDDD